MKIENVCEYRLPLSRATLYEWSQYLHNCMYGYCNAIHKSDTIIYGVFRDNVLLYAIEIRNHKIVQALGKYNGHIENEDRGLIDRWLYQ